MRLVRFSHTAEISYGILNASCEEITPIRGDIFGDWTRQGARLALKDVRLRAPVQPPNILAIGRNYRAHAMEFASNAQNVPLPKEPTLFIKANTAVADPNQTIMLPTVASKEVDYEAELVIVIGRRAHNVPEYDAKKFILGYTCGNDVTARDRQRVDGQWARGKSFDTFAPLGPWIETELNPDACNIQCRLNGRIMQDSNTQDLIFDTSKLVSYLSKGMTLMPGTVIMSGTPAGVGAARKPPVFLADGDVIEVEIEGIGVLRNPVANQTLRSEV